MMTEKELEEIRKLLQEILAKLYSIDDSIIEGIRELLKDTRRMG